VNSSSHQYAKSCILSLLVLLSIFSISVIQSVNAFSIGLPDIPFLNFNFDNNSPKEDSSSVIDFGTITNIAPKLNPQDDRKDNSDSDLKYSHNGENNEQSNDDNNQLSSASLPFPANLMNSVYGNENENTNEVNKTPLDFHNTLPLVGDYTEVPSTFLSDTTTPDDAEIPGQYIVVFKDDDTNVSDFFSMVSSKIGTTDIELLHVYENVLNGLTIQVPNEKVIEAVEELPIVDYVEKDVMAEAFAQTLPSAVLGVLTLDTEPI
jgi:subtilisin